MFKGFALEVIIDIRVSFQNPKNIKTLKLNYSYVKIRGWFCSCC